MKRYPDYKDSGVLWIGEIPTHWEMRKVSRSFNRIGSGTTPLSDRIEYYNNGTIPWVQTGDLNNGYLTSTSRKVTQLAFDDHSALKLYPPETLLIAMYGATIGKIAIMGFEGCTNQACCAIAGSAFILTNFAFYWFLANKQHVISLGYGGGQPNISQDIVRALRISTPPLPEQQAIADFLDCKTAQIDTIIEKKQRQIDLLQEQRTALINHAVTQGLNPDAPMKDSGVEWLGQIPSHWTVAPIRRLVTDHKQGFYSNESYVNQGTKLLRITDIDDSANVDFTHCPMVDVSNNDKESFGLEVGDFVFVRTGATVGKFGIIREKANAIFASYLIRFRFSHRVASDYLKYYFFSYYFWHGLVSDIHGGANHNIHAENIKNQYIALPPVLEQKEIVSKLDIALTPILEQIEKIKKEIELILEYRTALISEAVTGKIDVR